MAKITVLDTKNKYHTFHGDVFATEDDGGCRVFKRMPDGKSRLVQSFSAHLFGWLRIEENEDALQDRTPSAMLAPAKLDEYTKMEMSRLQAQIPSIMQQSANDFENDYIPSFDQSDPHEDDAQASKPRRGRPKKNKQEAAQDQSQETAAEMTIRLAKEQRLLDKHQEEKTIAAGWPGDPALDNFPNPTIFVTDEINQDIVLSNTANQPAPTLNELMTSGLIQVGADNLKKPENKATDAPVIIAEEINQDDIEKALAEAEMRQQSSYDCETCNGRGTVPDPESCDPLDTMLCPDC